MRKFHAKRMDGLLRLVEMGEMDVFDALEAVPKLLSAMSSQDKAERYEERRRAWLARYEPDWPRIKAEENTP